MEDEKNGNEICQKREKTMNASESFDQLINQGVRCMGFRGGCSWVGPKPYKLKHSVVLLFISLLDTSFGNYKSRKLAPTVKKAFHVDEGICKIIRTIDIHGN